MNVGQISNMSYMGYIRPSDQIGLPTMRPSSPASPASKPVSPYSSPQLSPLSLPSVTPYNQTPGAPFMTLFNLDGDTAQFTLPALNKSSLADNPYTQATQPLTPDTERIAPLDPNEPCETCANRKYVDGSDDSSVSFQTPTNISPNMAAAAVASHENEHVRNEQANAARDGREIVQQSVTLHYDVCEECGRHYVSGGTTRTTSVSKGDSQSPADFIEDNQGGQNNRDNQDD